MLPLNRRRWKALEIGRGVGNWKCVGESEGVERVKVHESARRLSSFQDTSFLRLNLSFLFPLVVA